LRLYCRTQGHRAAVARQTRIPGEKTADRQRSANLLPALGEPMPKIEWGILIVNYLFLGGLSAGIFFVSALATHLQDKDQAAYGRIARYGAMMAPWPVAAGSLLLIFDLGNWSRFYKLFLHFRWQSPMSIGSWLLMVFTWLAG